MARDERYRKTILLPMARSKAAPVERAIYEHLSVQSSYAAIAESADLPGAFHEAITTPFETAMELRAELDACGGYVQPTWFEEGCKFDARVMEPSVHVAPADPAQRTIAMTLLPGVDIRFLDGPWSVFARATVHRSSPNSSG